MKKINWLFNYPDPTEDLPGKLFPEPQDDPTLPPNTGK
jgi:hypothetical protein